MQKKWKVAKKIDKELINKFLEINPIILQLLANRGITEQERINEFLFPDYRSLNDPFLFSDMEKAVKVIRKAIKERKRITVFGDYDADGITSSAVLINCLKELGAKCNVYIPDRKKEGYGLNAKAIEILSKKKTDLIITVDCGITNNKEIKKIKDLGMEVIITDHHYPSKEKPHCLIINAQVDHNYPFKELAGVGVAFKLSQALLSKISKKNSSKKEAFEKWLLDLVAIGTIADCVSLIGENRILTKYGLIVLNKTKREGLKALIKKSSLNLSEINTYDISFRLSPRINAAGRMNKAIIAYDLLMSNSFKKSSEITEDLNQLNLERQKITDLILKKAIKDIGESPKEKILFSLQKDCPVGILGLVAGRVVSHYNKPSFILTEQDQKIIGSGRSIPKFNMIKALNKMSDLFSHFGGHSQACGLTLKNEDELNNFKDEMLKIANSELIDKDLRPVLEIDAKINLSDINWNFFDDLAKFAPFGQNNVKPIFLTKNLKILSSREVGKNGNHLKFSVSDSTYQGGYGWSCIGFGLSENWRGRLKRGDLVDLVYYIEENRWNGSREIQLKIIDLKHSELK
ncbi:MAG: single-stranded-DNA-specific exonuclease RecJ [Xanthomonadaceae bacterium]|nr:single-stranded-DNA-specific exonuclease RecJ [Rhodospirillaceae bacterium]NIA17601.1 single-stranded-DNA-specific exonuclease RecJ [Xanthomonadaceae bacterium]